MTEQLSLSTMWYFDLQVYIHLLIINIYLYINIVIVIQSLSRV